MNDSVIDSSALITTLTLCRRVCRPAAGKSAFADHSGSKPLGHSKALRSTGKLAAMQRTVSGTSDDLSRYGHEDNVPDIWKAVRAFPVGLFI